MFRIQYFKNSFSILGCVFTVLWWIIFFSPLHHTPSLEARPQLSKSIWIFHWGLRARLVCARQEQGPLHLLLICAQAWPGPTFLHVLLSFYNDLFLFIQSWNPQEPLQSQAHIFLISLGPWSDGTFSTLLPLVCSFPVGFSFTFTCKILPWCNFPSVLQCTSWRSCEKCDALLTSLLPARQPCDCSSGSELVPVALGYSRGILD